MNNNNASLILINTKEALLFKRLLGKKQYGINLALSRLSADDNNYQKKLEALCREEFETEELIGKLYTRIGESVRAAQIRKEHTAYLNKNCRRITCFATLKTRIPDMAVRASLEEMIQNLGNESSSGADVEYVAEDEFSPDEARELSEMAEGSN